jgi:hypothetical protein
MMKSFHFALLLLCAGSCFGQSPSDKALPMVMDSREIQTGVVPLVAPYAISTAPHFAVLVQFPKSDSIRRIALGDSNYFLAEADKDDPHYAIVKQIRASGVKPKSPIETNMLVYMASGRVVNIMLKAGKLADTAYSVDYPVPNLELAHDSPPVPAPPQPDEKTSRERARTQLAEKMVDEIRKSPKAQPGIAAGGVTLRFYQTERMDELALVSFDIENTSKEVIDLEDPQVNLVTIANKTKNRKKNPIVKTEPIELAQSLVSAKQLAPGARAVCLVAFKPPAHDSDQQVVFSVSNRATADQPAKFRIE